MRPLATPSTVAGDSTEADDDQRPHPARPPLRVPASCCGCSSSSIVYALRSDLFGQRARKMPADAAGAAAGASIRAAAPAAPRAPSAPQCRDRAAARHPAVTARRRASSSRRAPRPASRCRSATGRSRSGGRNESNLVIRDDYTSTHHARLMLWNGRWVIQDLDSTNGTFLDGERVTVPTPVPVNTTVTIGADELRAAAVGAWRRMSRAPRCPTWARSGRTTKTAATPARSSSSSPTAWAGTRAATSPRPSRSDGSARPTASTPRRVTPSSPCSRH